MNKAQLLEWVEKKISFGQRALNRTEKSMDIYYHGFCDALTLVKHEILQLSEEEKVK